MGMASFVVDIAANCTQRAASEGGACVPQSRGTGDCCACACDTGHVCSGLTCDYFCGASYWDCSISPSAPTTVLALLTLVSLVLLFSTACVTSAFQLLKPVAGSNSPAEEAGTESTSPLIKPLSPSVFEDETGTKREASLRKRLLQGRTRAAQHRWFKNFDTAQNNAKSCGIGFLLVANALNTASRYLAWGDHIALKWFWYLNNVSQVRDPSQSQTPANTH